MLGFFKTQIIVHVKPPPKISALHKNTAKKLFDQNNPRGLYFWNFTVYRMTLYGKIIYRFFVKVKLTSIGFAYNF